MLLCDGIKLHVLVINPQLCMIVCAELNMQRKMQGRCLSCVCLSASEQSAQRITSPKLQTKTNKQQKNKFSLCNLQEQLIVQALSVLIC